MTKKAFDKIAAGLADALAYAQGDTSRGVAYQVIIPDQVDVRALRAARPPRRSPPPSD